MTFPFPILLMKGPVFPGSQSFTTPGTFQFQVPEYNTLTATVRGGGGQGFGLGAGYNGAPRLRYPANTNSYSTPTSPGSNSRNPRK